MQRRIIIVILTLAIALSATGRDRPFPLRERPHHAKMRAFNIGITAFFTVFSAMRQGRLEWHEVPRYLLIGAGAGAAFYEAKRLTGDGNKTAGWILTNVATSVIENTTSRERMFGRLGYTIGPIRLRVATPHATKGVATIEADWSLAETGLLGYALYKGDSVSFRNGLIAVDRETPWDLDGRNPEGATFGIYPGVIPGAKPETWPHEMIHAIQSQQFDAVEAPQWTFGGEDKPRNEWQFFRLRHIKVGYTHAPQLAYYYTREYEDRWIEVEAWWLAEETPVQP